MRSFDFGAGFGETGAAGWVDPLAGISFALRLQTHRGDGVPVGLYQDTACTVPAEEENDPIAAWRDEIFGSGLTAVQSNAMKQPTLRFVGGKPVVRMLRPDDYLEFPAVTPFELTAGGEIIVAASAEVTVAGPGDFEQDMWFLARDTDTGRSFAFGVGTFPMQVNGSGDVANISNTGRSVFGYRGNASVGWIMRKNGADIGSMAWAAPTSTATLPSIGRRQYPGFEGYMDGDMVALTLSAAVLSNDERVVIETYFATL